MGRSSKYTSLRNNPTDTDINGKTRPHRRVPSGSPHQGLQVRRPGQSAPLFSQLPCIALHLRSIQARLADKWQLMNLVVDGEKQWLEEGRSNGSQQGSTNNRNVPSMGHTP